MCFSVSDPLFSMS